MGSLVYELFDDATFTLTYIIYDQDSLSALIIDPVLDYDPCSSVISTSSMKKILAFLKQKNLELKLILETHVHADHVTSAMELKKIFPKAKLGIGHHITTVQKTFKKLYNKTDLSTDGSQFDFLIADEQEIYCGPIKVKGLGTPGHTPACMSYLIDDMLFTGDALFMPDIGTGRCDFPGGSAKKLYHSIQKIYQLPDEMKLYTGHDYPPADRALKFVSTVGESKVKNIQLKANTTEAEFVSMRNLRDQTLKAPHLLLPSIQINIDGGRLPKIESNGVAYLKIPLDVKNFS